ncbi:MAG: NYN domain-containing protein [Ruminococcaceae bacterium]|nr:NYN domain-containing protein [Oscillospiraceae bacterium]
MPKASKRTGLFYSFKNIFSKKKELPMGIAFIDYEHWYIALEKMYGRKPDIHMWLREVQKKCDLKEVIFFANFSKFRDKEKEIKRIRTVTNSIIDTYNPDAHYKKDFTDFIILDNIYQKALSREDINTFIIFTGDGHFSSVCAFLKNFCHKEVGIYGVQGGISSTLIKNVSWVREIPLEFELNAPYYNMLFTYLKNIKEQRDIYPTFRKTAETVASMHDVEFDTIKQLLSELINDGYITQLTKNIRRHEQIRILEPNWTLIEKDGLWLKTSIFNN